MSCQKCEEVQDAENVSIAYLRWKNANIGLIGCDEHLKEVFVVLVDAQTEMYRAGQDKGWK